MVKKVVQMMELWLIFEEILWTRRRLEDGLVQGLS
jgi:hypothetical protein